MPTPDQDIETLRARIAERRSRVAAAERRKVVEEARRWCARHAQGPTILMQDEHGNPIIPRGERTINDLAMLQRLAKARG